MCVSLFIISSLSHCRSSVKWKTLLLHNLMFVLFPHSLFLQWNPALTQRNLLSSLQLYACLCTVQFFLFSSLLNIFIQFANCNLENRLKFSMVFRWRNLVRSEHYFVSFLRFSSVVSHLRSYYFLWLFLCFSAFVKDIKVHHSKLYQFISQWSCNRIITKHMS